MNISDPTPKSREEIEDLKKKWLADPEWPIAETEGFEAHWAELRLFQAETLAKQKAESEAVAARRKIMTYLDDITYGSRVKADDEISDWVGKGWTIFNVTVFVLDEGDGVSIMRSTTLIRS